MVHGLHVGLDGSLRASNAVLGHPRLLVEDVHATAVLGVVRISGVPVFEPLTREVAPGSVVECGALFLGEGDSPLLQIGINVRIERLTRRTHQEGTLCTHLVTVDHDLWSPGIDQRHASPRFRLRQ